MKILLLVTLLSFSAMAIAKKEEKTLEIKAHINKMMMTSNKMYRLELVELAAAYFAEEKHAPCLQKAISEKKEAKMKVTAYSLHVLECKVE